MKRLLVFCGVCIAIPLVVIVILAQFLNAGYYKNVTFIPTDIGTNIQGIITIPTGTYVIPDTKSPLNLLVTRGNKLYGVRTTNEFTNAHITSTTWNGTYINRQILGCDSASSTCYLLNVEGVSKPLSIVAYQYETQKFSVIYDFEKSKDLIVYLQTSSTQSIIAVTAAGSKSQPDKYYFLNVKTGTIDSSNTLLETDALETQQIVFNNPDDINYVFAENKNGISTGDKEIKVVDKTECAGGGLSGCSTNVTLFKNNNLIKTFDCHNCAVRYAGKNNTDIFLLILKDAEVKVGKIKI